MTLKTWPNSCLTTTCRFYDFSHKDELMKLVEEMKNIVTEYEAHGIAANQLGSDLRVCVISSDRGKTHKTMINPEIINRGGEFSGDEACLSLPGVLVPVKRSAACEVGYLNEQFEWHVEQLIGFEAVVVQHEVDHLNGITIMQSTHKVYRDRARRQLKKAVRAMKNMSNPRKMSSSLSREIKLALKKAANKQVEKSDEQTPGSV
jgi:peptide deformylase